MNFKNAFLSFKIAIITFLKKLQKDDLLLCAQGLTFNTLLTLVPLLGLVLSISKIFIPQQKFVEQVFINIAQYLTPEATKKVMDTILELVKKLETFPLGKFSLIGYFIMGLGLLFQIEEILNRIFESSKRRNFIQRIIFFWVCITIVPFIFFMPVYSYFYLGNFSNFFILLILAFIFFLMYIYFPAKDVPKKEALIGAFFSTILWTLSSYLYSFYVKYAVGYSKVYGSLSAIPLFLVWLFVNWLVFLLGAELVVFLEQKIWKRIPIDPSHPYLKLYILYLLGKNFIEGKPCNIFEFSEYLNVSPILLESILQELEKEGFVAVRDEEVFFVKPLQKINITKVVGLNKFQELLKLPEGDSFSQKLSILTKNFSEITLEDLIKS
ncbi:ribonuclease BN [Thermodesulfobacterium geofontis OPF15]|jgi:membrane protein|uniref:Ribonuclease BN n=1 Tax=Thermodesulfobacterium geofontis (strain OPF15) TaxID=795359 RepID=F8C4A2_THEGP|nr:YihY/virulence factor BrkB family protein [Thermodesulfobacterium geofontis]AEH22603.1 ribonuclease BN [Thermodesulfobacterium geofontis OPF15]